MIDFFSRMGLALYFNFSTCKRISKDVKPSQTGPRRRQTVGPPLGACAYITARIVVAGARAAPPVVGHTQHTVPLITNFRCRFQYV